MKNMLSLTLPPKIPLWFELRGFVPDVRVVVTSPNVAQEELILGDGVSGKLDHRLGGSMEKGNVDDGGTSEDLLSEMHKKHQVVLIRSSTEAESLSPPPNKADRHKPRTRHSISHFAKKSKVGQTDRPTDRPTDGPTDRPTDTGL